MAHQYLHSNTFSLFLAATLKAHKCLLQSINQFIACQSVNFKTDNQGAQGSAS
jgi:hypothetical protein